MGGPIDRESLSTFSYELPIGQLKVELNSNIIPIGKIQTGIYYHRALLFKVSSICRLAYKSSFESWAGSKKNILDAGENRARTEKAEKDFGKV